MFTKLKKYLYKERRNENKEKNRKKKKAAYTRQICDRAQPWRVYTVYTRVHVEQPLKHEKKNEAGDWKKKVMHLLIQSFSCHIS